ncbi:MAG TPA: aminodeoxychorismate/anthranilate synthase component II [Gemmatimonadaceae bacterium]|nr:aminodeoxychorismate/anthranilate synthase component II [Gemmatimonadaceae bacterium]
MILVIDNYDSFTYNLVQYLGELGAEICVRRNDDIGVSGIKSLRPSAIVISPGPGVPADAGVSVEVIRQLGAEIPILGVCLGHQAIAEAYGGQVVRAAKLMHGKTSRILHTGTDLFDRIASPLEVMRYHSLTVDPASLPAEIEVLAWGEEDNLEIHAMRHRLNPVWGVQFHPESIMTQSGRNILANFLRLAA